MEGGERVEKQRLSYCRHKTIIRFKVKVGFLPEAGVLLQTGRHHVLVLLAVDGTGGVDQALQAREPEAMI